MKEGFAVLPLEVWADITEHPLLTRQMLAQIADNNGDPMFTNKLQKLMHGYGKHSLRCLDISSKPPDETTQESKIEPKCKALLAVAPDYNGWVSYVRDGLTTTKECEFPQTEVPENIKNFKRLSIRYLDDEVLVFLNKIKSLFNNVYLVSFSTQSAPNDIQIVFTQLLPMFGSIRGIFCDDIGVELLEQQFPGTLARAGELDLFDPKLASIPAYLDWLNTPLAFDAVGPRFLKAFAESETNFAMIDAVRKQFLTATTSTAFVIFLQFYQHERHNRADETTFENATTEEELTVRNAIFKKPNGEDIHYAEIVRHPTGANAKIREWIKERAYYEKRFNDDGDDNKVIWIDQQMLTIGHITNQAADNSANIQDNDYADRQSTSAKGQ